MSFSPFEVTLEGRHLVEASAGSGKTYNIVRIYLRLVLQLDAKLEKILVVTFTEAAAAELNERIRDLLVLAVSVLEGTQSDSELTEFFATRSNPDKDRHILNLAIRSFDRARISTIHGFCHKILTEFAFLAGQSFTQKLVPSQKEWLHELVDDFKVRFCFEIDTRTVQLLESFSPSDLHKIVEIGCADSQAPLAHEYVKPASLALLQQELISTWRDRSEDLLALLVQKKTHSGRLRAIREHFGRMSDHEYVDHEVDKTFVSLLKEDDKHHLHHPFVLSVRRWVEASTQWRLFFTTSLVNFAREAFVQRKRRADVMSFDDVLTQLDESLNGPNGVRLTRSVQESTPFALVDEFQDTDPVQARIFERLFADRGCLFTIGDPKQSIYGFRRADIREYLRFKKLSGMVTHRLDSNWRSSNALILAVNRLFSTIDSAFAHPEIQFRPALPGGQARPLLGGQAAIAPCRISVLEGSRNSDLELDAVQLLVQEINDLLVQQKKDNLPWKARDVAVLVHTHAQASQVVLALTQRGIPCSYQGAKNVFEAEEAEDLAVILAAIAEPRQLALVKRALVTPIMGFDARELLLLEEDLSQWSEVVLHFRSLRETWAERGFIRMFRRFVSRWDLESRLLGMEQGERRLTNFLQLGERLGQVAHRHHLGPAALLRWLDRRHLLNESEDEIRLETDEDAVHVMTVFASKGLEFSAVFCPFSWMAPRKLSDKIALQFAEDGSRSLLFADSEGWDTVRAGLEHQQRAESMRLLYVALTRARDFLHVFVGCGTRAESMSPLNALIVREQQWTDAKQGDKKRPLQWQSAIDFWTRETTIDIRWAELNPAPVDHQSSNPPKTLTARAKKKKLPESIRQTSFSMITSGGSHLDTPGWVDDEPHEMGMVIPDDASPNFADFPRGAQAGNCLHRMLEGIDFQDEPSKWQPVILDSLTRFGYSSDRAESVSQALQSVVQTPLDTSGLSLAQIPMAKRLVEWEFTMPLTRQNKKLSPSELARVFGIEGGQTPVSYHLELAKLEFRVVEGFLKGFVDLVFEHADQWFVIDYKSNDLGPNLSDFHPQAMTKEMVRHHYILQYHLYSVALHKYLQVTKNDYDYDKHFGGVYYLFLRGMAKHEGVGVYCDRPPRNRIESLLQLMRAS